jgi:hypothetical protein
MTEVCLFLGAGASKAIGGYPTTKEFMDRLEKRLSNDEKVTLKAICKRPNVEDIENILEIIDPIVKSGNSMLHDSIKSIADFILRNSYLFFLYYLPTTFQ